MMKPKKRLSAGMGFSADGIDPLFEFDVPRVFADLTLPPRYAKATRESFTSVVAHDAWFDLVHENHSRPTEEFLAAQQHDQAQSDSATFHRTFHHHHHVDADGEKENGGGLGSGSGGGGATRLKRRNVAYSVQTDAAPVATIKATMRTVSASSATAKASAKAAKKPTTKLPFGSSTGPKSSSASASASAASQKGANAVPRKRTVAERSTEASKARSHAAPVRGQSGSKPVAKTGSDKDLQDLQALLAKHNKKFKANHTYEPRQHSVRDVRMWERQTQKSYYKLTLEDRFQANAEIAQLVRDREDAAAA